MVGGVERRRDRLVDDLRQGQRPVGDDLDRVAVRRQGRVKNRRAVLVDSPVHVPPHTVDLDVGLAREPRIPLHTLAGARRVDH
jgi:hypothetical protein